MYNVLSRFLVKASNPTFAYSYLSVCFPLFKNTIFLFKMSIKVSVTQNPRLSPLVFLNFNFPPFEMFFSLALCLSSRDTYVGTGTAQMCLNFIADPFLASAPAIPTAIRPWWRGQALGPKHCTEVCRRPILTAFLILHAFFILLSKPVF